MEPTKYTVSILKQLLKEHGVRGYSGQRKAELIAMLQASDPQPQTWESTRPSPPPIRTSPPPRSKRVTKTKIKQLESKKRNLKIRIRSNPKLREKLRGKARKRLRGPHQRHIECLSLTQCLRLELT